MAKITSHCGINVSASSPNTVLMVRIKRTNKGKSMSERSVWTMNGQTWFRSTSPYTSAMGDNDESPHSRKRPAVGKGSAL